MASYFFLIYLMFKNSISSSSSFLRPGPALSGHQRYIFRRSLQLDANRFLRGRASGRQRAMRDLDSRVRRLVRCSERRCATVENELELDSDLVSSIQIWWLDQPSRAARLPQSSGSTGLKWKLFGQLDQPSLAARLGQSSRSTRLVQPRDQASLAAQKASICAQLNYSTRVVQPLDQASLAARLSQSSHQI